MKKVLTTIILASALFIFTGVVKTQNVFAGITCNLGEQGFNPNDGSLQFCVGGFSSKEDLKKHFLTFQCLKEKGALACGGLIVLKNLPLSDVPDDQIAQSADGTFYTCRTVNMDPRVELVTIAVRDPVTRQSVCDFKSTDTSGLYSQGGPLNRGISTTTQNTVDLLCNNGGGIKTAIGCIPFSSTTDLVNFILKWALGIAGGIAFLLILVAGFQITTSRGDPNRLKAGQELLTSAVAGLILLIFSIFILRVIGFNILGITAFGGK